MTSSFAMTGLAGSTYRSLFRKHIRKVKPPVFGMAVAYVSASGFNLVKSILDEGEVGEVHLVTDTKDGITHPKALQGAMDSGWEVRVVDSLAGTFHPKLYVGAAAFDNGAGVSGPSLAIVGSPNLSHGGFLANGECTFWSTAPHTCDSAARAWFELISTNC
jgi:HKD family nuclease